LPSNSQGLFLLQRIRDEAHRFAITAHRKRRNKAAFVSRLDQIPGIGPSRKKELLHVFGSIEGIKKASVPEIAKISGITSDLAAIIHSTLQSD